MTIKEVEYILRNAAWLGPNEDREATEAVLELAIAAVKKQEGKKPFPDSDKSILACQYCGSGEYLHNADENINQYCGQCGQKIDWTKGE